MNANQIRKRLKPVLEKYPKEYHKELGKLIFDIRDAFRSPPASLLTHEAQQKIAASETNAQSRIKMLELELSNLRYTAETRKAKIAALEKENAAGLKLGVFRGFWVAVASIIMNLIVAEHEGREDTGNEAWCILKSMLYVFKEEYGGDSLHMLLADLNEKLYGIEPDAEWDIIMEKRLFVEGDSEDDQVVYLPKLKTVPNLSWCFDGGDEAASKG